MGTSIASYAPVLGPVIRELLLGGPEVGQSALTRFFTLHVAVVPVLLMLVITLHLWRVRTSGGLAASAPDLSEDASAEGV